MLELLSKAGVECVARFYKFDEFGDETGQFCLQDVHSRLRVVVSLVRREVSRQRTDCESTDGLVAP